MESRNVPRVKSGELSKMKLEEVCGVFWRGVRKIEGLCFDGGKEDGNILEGYGGFTNRTPGPKHP